VGVRPPVIETINREFKECGQGGIIIHEPLRCHQKGVRYYDARLRNDGIYEHDGAMDVDLNDPVLDLRDLRSDLYVQMVVRPLMA
jgi:hypothetical protein